MGRITFWRGNLEVSQGGMTMEFKTRTTHGVTIGDLSGRLTAEGGDVVLRSQIERLLDVGARSILLNLSDLQTIDSSGIGELTSAKKDVQAVGGSLKLLNVGAAIRRASGMASLLAEFEVFDDETRAVASFGA
jgi:anti-sigma B factor antagonist